MSPARSTAGGSPCARRSSLRTDRARRLVRLRVRGARALRLEACAEVHPPDPYAGAFASAMRIRRGDRVLDLGCGTGAYGLAAAARGAGAVTLTDVLPAAICCALGNASRNGLRVAQACVGEFFEPLRGERFDVVITSLPQLPAHLPVEPSRYGGPDGLHHLRRLADEAAAHLKPAGRLYILVTDWAYPPRVKPLFERRGFRLRRVARVERAFQPVEYDRMAPGLFRYLDALAGKGLAAYRREGAWCYLGVSLFEGVLSGTRR